MPELKVLRNPTIPSTSMNLTQWNTVALEQAAAVVEAVAITVVVVVAWVSCNRNQNGGIWSGWFTVSLCFDSFHCALFLSPGDGVAPPWGDGREGRRGGMSMGRGGGRGGGFGGGRGGRMLPARGMPPSRGMAQRSMPPRGMADRGFEAPPYSVDDHGFDGGYSGDRFFFILF